MARGTWGGLFSISTGGLMDVKPNIPIYGGYQATFSAQIKQAVSIPVTAVGLLHNPEVR